MSLCFPYWFLARQLSLHSAKTEPGKFSLVELHFYRPLTFPIFRPVFKADFLPQHRRISGGCLCDTEAGVLASPSYFDAAPSSHIRLPWAGSKPLVLGADRSKISLFSTPRRLQNFLLLQQQNSFLEPMWWFDSCILFKPKRAELSFCGDHKNGQWEWTACCRWRLWENSIVNWASWLLV